MTAARRALLVVLIAATALGVAGVPARPEGWYAEVDTTLGSFTIKLIPEQAPQTVAHFAAYAQGKMEFVDLYTGSKKKAPFYDGLKVHKTSFARRFEAGDRSSGPRAPSARRGRGRPPLLHAGSDLVAAPLHPRPLGPGSRAPAGAGGVD